MMKKLALLMVGLGFFSMQARAGDPTFVETLEETIVGKVLATYPASLGIIRKVNAGLSRFVDTGKYKLPQGVKYAVPFQKRAVMQAQITDAREKMKLLLNQGDLKKMNESHDIFDWSGVIDYNKRIYQICDKYLSAIEINVKQGHLALATELAVKDQERIQRIAQHAGFVL